jgi:hypothetical protein
MQARGSGSVSLKPPLRSRALRDLLAIPASGVQIIMKEKHTPLRSLLEELRNAPHGAIQGHAKYKVMHLPAKMCWPVFGESLHGHEFPSNERKASMKWEEVAAHRLTLVDKGWTPSTHFHTDTRRTREGK